MTLKKSEKRLIIILGIFLFAFLFDRFILSPGKDNETAPPTDTVDFQASNNQKLQMEMAALAKKVKKSTSKDVKYDAWGRDPFNTPKSSSTVGKKRRKIELKGIFWKNGKGYVLINSYILREGEEKGGIKVEKIESEKVTCRSEGRSFTLQWRKS